MLKQYKDRCTFVVVMEGTDGRRYETECKTPREAVKLERHHIGLGYNAWIEIKKAENETV